ncbi:hypothetical protein C8R47DRAFT_1193960 [Mycena vitilis]|nr:hypothetical protein C8R47DRAFT_1193960 [Mycena vitilis]
MEGGDPQEFWRRETAEDVIEPTTEHSTIQERAIAKSLSQSHGYNGFDAGIGYLLPEQILLSLERINIKSDTAPKDDVSPNVHGLSSYFKRNVENPPDNLKELVISLSFDVVSEDSIRNAWTHH